MRLIERRNRRFPIAGPVIGLVLVLTLTAALPAAAQRGADRLPGLDGGALTQSDLTGRNSIVVFWAGWSPKCRTIVERINALHGRWGDSTRVVSVNFQEDEADIRAFLDGKTLRAPVYLDSRGAFSRTHAVTDLPGLVIYRDGEIAYQGRLPQDVDKLIQRVLG